MNMMIPNLGEILVTTFKYGANGITFCYFLGGGEKESEGLSFVQEETSPKTFIFGNVVLNLDLCP